MMSTENLEVKLESSNKSLETIHEDDDVIEVDEDDVRDTESAKNLQKGMGKRRRRLTSSVRNFFERLQ